MWLASGSPSPTPTITFTSPPAGSTVSGSVSVSAAAAVSAGSITSVTLKADGSTLKSCSSAACTVAWDTTALSNGSYTLEADTTASDGNTNAATETVTVTNAHPVSLTPPSHVASPSQTTTGISLTWQAGSDSQYPASQLSYAVSRNGSPVGTTAAGVTSYSDSGLSAGTVYSYTLVTTDPAGHSSVPSAAFTQSTKAPDCATPAAPQGFTASGVQPTVVPLSWAAVPNPSSSCVVLHYLVARGGVPLASPTSTSYTDTSATPQTTYTYTTLAVETGNIAGGTSSLQVTTPPSGQPDPGPSSPTNLNASAVSAAQVNLTWTPSTDPVTGIKQYNVLRNNQVVGTTTSPSFGDSGLSASTQYGYTIQAVSGGDKTATSASVNVTTLPAQTTGSSHGGTPLPPILQGTQSVGAGSDSGGTTSSNPTDPGSSTAGVLGVSSTTSPGSGHQQGSGRTVAYLGGSTALVIGLLAAGYWFILRPRRFAWRPRHQVPYDPDFQARIVVGDGRQGPQPKGPMGGA